MTAADRLLHFMIEVLETGHTAHGRPNINRAALVGEAGVRFELTGSEPPYLAVRSTTDEDRVPVLQLLGRDDPDQDWRVLQQITRQM